MLFGLRLGIQNRNGSLRPPGQLRCPVMIGVGGSLDMLVGDKKRAPRWLQRSGGERRLRDRWTFYAPISRPGIEVMSPGSGSIRRRILRSSEAVTHK